MAYYICPVCRSPRQANLQDKLPAMTHVRIAAGLGLMIGALILGGAGIWTLKLGLFYFPIWGVLELIHWSHQRQITKCGNCNFDPFLYQKDWRAARTAVELKLNTIKTEMLAQRGASVAPIAVAATDGTTTLDSVH